VNGLKSISVIFWISYTYSNSILFSVICVYWEKMQS